MEIIVKSCVIAILGTLICLLLKKQNPEFSTLISVAIVVLLLSMCITLLSAIKEFVDYAVKLMGNTSSAVRPILKCLAISLISKFGSDICRDASQTALASTLEVSGVICAAVVSIPMLSSILKMIGAIV